MREDQYPSLLAEHNLCSMAIKFLLYCPYLYSNITYIVHPTNNISLHPQLTTSSNLHCHYILLSSPTQLHQGHFNCIAMHSTRSHLLLPHQLHQKNETISGFFNYFVPPRHQLLVQFRPCLNPILKFFTLSHQIFKRLH